MTGTEPKACEPIKLEATSTTTTSGAADPAGGDSRPVSRLTPPATPIKMIDATMQRLGKQCNQKAADICNCCGSKKPNEPSRPTDPGPPPPTAKSIYRCKGGRRGECRCDDLRSKDGKDELKKDKQSKCSTLRLFVLCLALLQLVQVMGSG